MAKHHPDLIFCRKQPGVGELRLSVAPVHQNTSQLSFFAAIGRLCEKCDGKCVICDSYVRPCTLVRICDECNYGSYQGRCVICGGPGVSDAYYCKECTIQEKDVRIYLIVCVCTFFITKWYSKTCFLERRLSQDSQLGKLKNRSLLREEEIWIQKKIVTLLLYRTFPKYNVARTSGNLLFL